MAHGEKTTHHPRTRIVKAATRILGLRGDEGSDGAEAALLSTPTIQGMGLGMACPTAAGKIMNARRLNEGLGSHDDAHAAALWEALRNANKNVDDPSARRRGGGRSPPSDPDEEDDGRRLLLRGDRQRHRPR
jgi:hypothetical protein